MKIITVESNQATSLQYHTKRQEFWKILSGEGTLTVGDKTLPAKIGDEISVLQGAKHRLEGGKTPLVLLKSPSAILTKTILLESTTDTAELQKSHNVNFTP